MKEMEINMTEYNFIQVFIECPSGVEKCVAQSSSRLVAAKVIKDHITNSVRIKIGLDDGKRARLIGGRERGRGGVARFGN